MRVALVCPYSWTVPGGVQTHVAGLAAALRGLGVDADVLAPADGPADGVRRLGRSVPIPSNGSIQRVALGPLAVARTARAVRTGGYDIVHVHEPMLPAVCLTAVAAAQAPLVATFHMFREELLWYRVFRPVVRAASRRLAARIAVSDVALSYVARTLPGDYEVIPNGIDYAALSTLAGKRRGRRILFVGRSEPRKGLPVLLDAFGALRGDAELVLVGPTGSYGPGVRALGRVTGPELRRQLADADVLCAPSLRGESFGVVLAEGMAAGLPVVASAIPGYEGVLPQAAGRLVPPGDAHALANALRELLDDRSLRHALARAGREEARRYAWPVIAGRVLSVYERVLARPAEDQPPATYTWAGA